MTKLLMRDSKRDAMQQLKLTKLNNRQMNNLTILIYFVFVITIITLTGYVVFILNHSGWWFLAAILLVTQIRPINKNDGNN